MRRIGLACCVMIVALGCATVSTKSDYMAERGYQSREAMTGSLFPGDSAVLSNEAIDTILRSKITLAPGARLAVLCLDEADPWRHWWREGSPEADAAIVGPFLEKVQTAERIVDASVLPALLVPERRTIPHLREAAARYQADLLLLYRSSSILYGKEKLLAADEAKATCHLEAVLLDVRTGIVPFTSAAVETYMAKQVRDDLTFDETMRKAEMEALGKALHAMADDLVEFLCAMPTQPTAPPGAG